MNARPRLGYASVPVPQRAFRARRERRLSRDEFVLLSCLYERANWEGLRARRACVSLTLAQLADAAASDDDAGTFGRRLRRLRDKPERWFTYRIEGRNRYVFVLLPDAPNTSEVCPSSDRGGNGESEHTDKDPRPRLGSDRPRSEPATDGSAETIESERALEPVRDPQRLQKDTTATTEGGDLDDPFASESEIPWLPEVCEAIEKARERELPSEPEDETREGAWPASDWPHDPEADVWAERIRARENGR